MNIIEIADKIWKAESDIPGKIFVIGGGVHGNEKTGIAVVQRLRESIESGDLSLQSGSLYLILGNPKAIELNSRWSESECDLNRCFTDSISDEKKNSFEVQRAQTIMNALQVEDMSAHSVVGVDIHATNKPSEPFLVLQPKPTLAHRDIFSIIPSVRIVLYDPNLIFTGTPSTFDDYLNRNGNVGLCYETGHVDDLSRVAVVYDEMCAIGRHIGVFQAKEGEISPRNDNKNTYVLRERIVLSRDGFAYASGMGAYNFQPFRSGDCIGHHGSQALTARFNGVCIFPKLPIHWKIGEPVGFLAEYSNE